MTICSMGIVTSGGAGHIQFEVTDLMVSRLRDFHGRKSMKTMIAGEVRSLVEYAGGSCVPVSEIMALFESLGAANVTMGPI